MEEISLVVVEFNALPADPPDVLCCRVSVFSQRVINFVYFEQLFAPWFICCQILLEMLEDNLILHTKLIFFWKLASISAL